MAPKLVEEPLPPDDTLAKQIFMAIGSGVYSFRLWGWNRELNAGEQIQVIEQLPKYGVKKSAVDAAIVMVKAQEAKDLLASTKERQMSTGTKVVIGVGVVAIFGSILLYAATRPR